MEFNLLFFFFFFFFLYCFNGDQWHVLPRIKLIFKNYFSEKDSPFNIAIFRIVFFAFFLTHLNGWGKNIWFSQLPTEMMVPPIGMKFILSVVPVTPDLVKKLMILFIIFCFLAMVGCFARAASFLAAISGIYVIGITQFYGKVDHDHHMIWFMFILSASRCSDVLSIDSIWKTFREANQGRVTKDENSVVYALPLRFIWLLMGMIYFFPGFWKFFRSHDWAWSDNLKYQLYAQWFKNGGWLPFFRLDQHPLLYKMCGLGVIFFELFFIFFIFFPQLRPIAIISGLLFHQMTSLFMKIGFFNLQICYVAFINWAEFFARIRKLIFKKPFHINCKGRSLFYRRMIAILIKFDIFQCITSSDQIQPLKKFLFDQQIIKFTGVALLLINSFFGSREMTSGWPFACYPTFARRMQEASIETITPYGVMDNKEELVGFNTLKERMDLSKFTGMINSILAIPDGNQQKNKLKTLVSVMKMEGINLSHYSKIRFYKTTFSTQPGKASDPPILKRLLAEIEI